MIRIIYHFPHLLASPLSALKRYAHFPVFSPYGIPANYRQKQGSEINTYEWVNKEKLLCETVELAEQESRESKPY
jgi:hypothetical protein